MKTLICSVAISGSLLLSGCHNGDDKPPESKIQMLPEQTFAKAWDTQLLLQPGDTVKNLYVRDDAIHILTAQNFDHSLKRSSGELLYFNPVGNASSEFHGGPVVLNDGIIFPTTFTMELFNRKGRFQRTINLGFTVTSSAVGFGNFVFCGDDASGGRLACVDMTKPYNPVEWTILTMGPMTGAPAVYESNIFFGSFDGTVRACDETKTPIWPLMDNSLFKTGGKIVADLKVDKFGIYAASMDTRLYVINRQSGKLIWQYFAGTALEESPEVTSDTVYIYVPGQGLVALNKTETLAISEKKNVAENPYHEPKWTAANARRFLSQDATYAYVLSNDNHVLALDLKTGVEAFRSQASNFVTFGTNLKGDGIVYAATLDGLVVAIKPVLKSGTAGEMVFVPSTVGATAVAAAR